MQKRSLQDFSEKGCWISAAHHCLSPFSVGLCLQSTTHAPTCQQCHGSATGFLNYLHTSPIIIFHPQRKTSNPAQDQPDGRKSSVDAHAVSSYLGCSRILRHLISFLNIITGLPTWKKTCTRNIQPHLIAKPVKTVHRIHDIHEGPEMRGGIVKVRSC